MLALAAGGALGAGPDDLPTCGSEEMAHTGEFTPYDYSAVGFMLVVSLGIGKYNPDYSSFLVFNFSATANLSSTEKKHGFAWIIWVSLFSNYHTLERTVQGHCNANGQLLTSQISNRAIGRCRIVCDSFDRSNHDLRAWVFRAY